MILKNKSLLILVLVTGVTLNAVGQEKAKAGAWQFHSINNVGLLEGEAGSAFQLQTINGAQWRSWFAGVGAGLDFYKYRSVPLFIDLRKDFGKSRNKLFIYTDLGIHFAWITDQQKSDYSLNGQFNNGFYTDLGLGYKLLIGNHQAIQIALGYSLKKSTETYPGQIYNPFSPNYPFYVTSSYTSEGTMNYSLNRLTMKLGFTF